MSDLRHVLVLPSGAKLEIQHAPFAVSMKLLQTVAGELRSVSLGLKADLNFASDPEALAKLLGQDIPLDLIKNAICQLIASTSIERALGECMGRCLYDGKAIVDDTFEPASARGDYISAAWEVMKHNLSPFFKGLGAKSLTGKNPAGGSPP